MKTTELRSKVIPALLAGTGRQPLSLAGIGPLAALSLAGQALRFEQPAGPAEFAVEIPVEDDRQLLPESVRQPMIWLLRTRRLTEDVELALAWSFARLNRRPHPFDLPRLGGFAKAHAEELGPTAQAWAQREKPGAVDASSRHFFFRADELDATNWTSAQPAQRVSFVVAQRGKDPAAALDLLRSAWPNEEAEMRVRLLQAVAHHLSAADRPFLDDLKKDRAPRVRELAQRLLCRLPGATEAHPALAACLERIERTTAGILRNKIALKLQLPATVKEHQAKMWIRETFANVSCDELATALKLGEPRMIEAAAKDQNFTLALALMASADERLDLFELAIAQLPEAWEKLAQCGPMQLGGMSPAERERWAIALIGPYGAKPVFSYAVWIWIHRALRGPLPATVMQAVVHSAQWREKLAETKGPEWMELLAACCPGEQRPALRSLLETMELAQTVTAFALLDILQGMERG
jgi:hypothetical protein